MTPQSAQGRLHQLADRHQLAHLAEPNLGAARELHDDAAAHGRGVPALIEVGDHSGAVLLAYELSRKVALGMLLANGWRPAGGEGEHRITFEAAGILLIGQARKALSDASYLRQQRNDNMYRQERADPDAAAEANAPAERVITHALPALRRLTHPG
jgi:hypothetical protein